MLYLPVSPNPLSNTCSLFKTHKIQKNMNERMIQSILRVLYKHPHQPAPWAAPPPNCCPGDWPVVGAPGACQDRPALTVCPADITE